MTGTRYTPRDMLARLVAFDTTSRDGNLPLIEFVEDYLDGWGIPHLRVDYEKSKKTNLYASIGPDIAGGIVLSGHTDVVPVDGQAWTTDPFSLTEKESTRSNFSPRRFSTVHSMAQSYLLPMTVPMNVILPPACEFTFRTRR